VAVLGVAGMFGCGSLFFAAFAFVLFMRMTHPS
jgi:hypothetical protein